MEGLFEGLSRHSKRKDPMEVKKPKINKTTRILMKVGSVNITIYVSTPVSQTVKELCVRLEHNKLCPMRGKNNEVLAVLSRESKERPDHFTATGIAVLRRI